MSPNRRFLVAFSSALALAILAGCESAPQVGSDADRGASFASYRTFAMLPRDRMPPGLAADPMHNPQVMLRIEDELRQELERKGYMRTGDPMSADFVVAFTMGAQERIDLRSYPGGWGFGPAFAGGNAIDVRQYREGTLAIDVFDVKTRRPVWHGWAQKEITRKDVEQSAAPIHDAVASVLAKFPPS